MVLREAVAPLLFHVLDCGLLQELRPRAHGLVPGPEDLPAAPDPVVGVANRAAVQEPERRAQATRIVGVPGGCSEGRCKSLVELLPVVLVQVGRRERGVVSQRPGDALGKHLRVGESITPSLRPALRVSAQLLQTLR